MFTLVFTSVALQFCQEYNSSKAEMKLAELLKYPAKVQKCAGRVIQTKLTVQVDLRDILPGYIVIFGLGDLCPGDVRLITSKNLIVRGVMDNKGNNRYSRRSNNSFARVKKHLFHGRGITRLARGHEVCWRGMCSITSPRIDSGYVPSTLKL